MSEMRKITVNLPVDLVESATGLSGRGITETIRAALEAELKRRAYQAFSDLRGKVTYDATWETLRGKDEPELNW